jgi:serine/threonine-protein kinase
MTGEYLNISPAQHVQPGEVLAGKYRVEGVLGAGGMGVVVVATHIVLKDRVAIKFLLEEFVHQESLVARFLREAQAAVRIKSPHVARVTDVGTLETGAPYMVMEFLEGEDLGGMLSREGTLRTEVAVDLALQVCEALAAAHVAGVVHRDIKPGNLFMAQGPDHLPVIKVLDFGVSKLTDASTAGSLTATHVAIGSPLYMSPEQMRSAKDVDARTDLWSLGVVMFEMLTGAAPFNAESMPQLIALVLEADAPSMRLLCPDLPEELDAIVARCLTKDRDKRFADAGELASALAVFGGPDALESARRTCRILGTSSAGDRSSLSSIKSATLTKGAGAVKSASTATAFGRTDPLNQPAPRRALRYAAIGIGAAALLGIGAAVAVSLTHRTPAEVRASSSQTPLPDPASSTVPISSAAASIASPRVESSAPADSSPPAASTAAVEPINKPPTGTGQKPPRLPGSKTTKGGSVFDERQ